MKPILLISLVFLIVMDAPAQRVINIKDMGPDAYGFYDSSITKAIDSASKPDNLIDSIYFPFGTYTLGINRKRLTPLNPRACRIFNNGSDPQTPASILICQNRSKLVFKGDGANTILTLGNIAARVTELGFPHMGLHMFQLVDCDSIYFESLVLDGNKTELTDQEQQHIISVQSCRNIGMRDIVFRNAAGDGINMIGLSDTKTGILKEIQTDSVTIENNSFVNCGRSGIGFQRLVKNVLIIDSHFERTSDQDIDFEPSSTDSVNRKGSIENVRISRNSFIKNNKSASVTLTGGKFIHFSGNIITDGVIQAAISLNDFSINNNKFIRTTADKTANTARILLEGEITNGIISNNYIDSSDRNYTVIIQEQGGRYSRNNIFADNEVFGGIQVKNTGKIVITGNKFFAPPLSRTCIMISNSVIGQPTVADITDNTIDGFGKGIVIAPGRSSFHRLTISRNYFKKIKDSCIVYQRSSSASILTTPEVFNNLKEGSPSFHKFIFGFYPTFRYIIYGGTGFGAIPKMFLGYQLPISILPLSAPSGSLYFFEENNDHTRNLKVYSNYTGLWVQMGTL
jgi:hypothetical protein